MIEFDVNGRAVKIDADPTTPLLWALRDHLGLTGTKFGRGIAVRGACTVHVDGQPTRARAAPISALAGARIPTIEAIEADRVGRAVQDAWVRNDVVQCGYCQSGQVMAATALLKAKKSPSDGDVDEAMAGVLCRCGTYARIRVAIKDVTKVLG